MSWIDVGPFSGLPARGARVLRIYGMAIAVFRTGGDEVYALLDRCPHRGGPLSQGIVHADRVTCPLHDWIIDLKTGHATGPDEGCTLTFPVRLDAGRVLVDVPEPSTVAEGDCSRLEPPTAEDGDSPLRGPSLQGAAGARALAVFEPG